MCYVVFSEWKQTLELLPCCFFALFSCFAFFMIKNISTLILYNIFLVLILGKIAKVA